MYFALILFCSCGTRRSVAPQPVHVQVAEISPAVNTPIDTPAEAKFDYAPDCKTEPDHGTKPLVNTISRGESGTWRGDVQQALDSICSSPIFNTTQIGMYIYDLTDGCPLYAVNAGHRMRPASNQKIITSVAALSMLGGDYRFNTELWVTGIKSNGTLYGNIYVVGGMDPVLSAADVDELAATLKNSGINKVSGHICLDLSAKDDLQYGWGWCWDDDYGPLSALMVDAKDNFMSVWRKSLAKHGIAVRDTTVETGCLPKDTQRICCTGHTIDEVMKEVMKNSNNIYAESLFYGIAFSSGMKKAGRKHAVAKINELIDALGMDSKLYKIADGSGLSLYNYVTPELLVNMLNYAYIHDNIREHFFPTMPIAGIDGTLSKRMKDTAAMNNVRAKTGSVEGISSLSGYMISGNGHLLTFSIINQGIECSATGKDFQDSVCVMLCSKR